MATIIINAITHRAACLDALGEDDAAAYDKSIDDYFAKLGDQAKAEGFGFEIDDHGQGPASYRITDESSESDYNAAHEFMQSVADFWSAY